MPGIYWMAILTIALTATLCISSLNFYTHADRHYYWLIIAGLPLSLIVNRLVKTPVINAIASAAGVPLKLGPDIPLWFALAILLSAPVFEEAIKILPMVILPGRIFLDDASHALWAGLALGMGFGLGEAAFLAYGVGQSSTFNQLPWYTFTGFLVERLVVTFAHGFLTSIAVLGLYYGKRSAWLGYLSAVGLHTLINLGPILLALKLIPASVASTGTYAAILMTFLIFQRNIRILKTADRTAQHEVVYFQR